MTTQVTMKDGEIALDKGGTLLFLDRQDAAEMAHQVLALLGDRSAQLVTTNKMGDYLSATPQQAVDQAHGMVLAGLAEEQALDDKQRAERSVRAAELLADTAERYIGVVKRAYGWAR